MPNSYESYEKKRPIHKIPYSGTEKIMELIGLIGILINIILLIKYWPSLPSTIPTHFGFSGKPDSFGGKGTLFIMPIILLVLYFGLTILSRFPHVYNYLTPITENNAKVQYHIARKMMVCLKAEVVFTFTYIEWNTIMAALGNVKGLGLIFLPVTMIIIFGTIGYYIYRSIKA